MRGGAVWQLVGLITRRSQVQILPPLPNNKGSLKEGPFFVRRGGARVWAFLRTSVGRTAIFVDAVGTAKISAHSLSGRKPGSGIVCSGSLARMLIERASVPRTRLEVAIRRKKGMVGRFMTHLHIYVWGVAEENRLVNVPSPKRADPSTKATSGECTQELSEQRKVRPR
jgi:hypothetical protein